MKETSTHRKFGFPLKIAFIQKRCLIILLACFSFSATLSAAKIPFAKAALKVKNNINVQGTVKSEDGEALPGVSVRVKGTKLGVTTDIDGKFSLNVNETAILEISYIGYTKQEIAVSGQREISIVLKTATSNLDEVVVVGYGTIKRSDFTGSTSSLKFEGVNENRIISAPEALQGRISGVQILNNTGEPGSGMTFNIRGTTSITGSNQPLIVIDGQPIESSLDAATAGISGDGGVAIPPSDPLAAINPADIASIEVLKDASSIAIYGSRGANGVVLITTKAGKAGAGKIAYTTRFDVSMLPKQIDMTNSLEYMQFRNEASINGGDAPPFSQKQLDSIQQSPNTNWQDLIYRRALSQDHQISFSGKQAKSDFLVSANYSKQNSIIYNADYTRGGARINYQTQVTPKVTVNVHSYFSLANRDFAQQSTPSGILGSSVVLGALVFSPLRVPYVPNDEGEEDFDTRVQNNPLLVLQKVTDKTSIRTLISNFSVDYKITKDLSLQSRAAVNDVYSLRRLFEPTGTFRGDAVNRSATRSDNSNSNFLFDNILTYKKTIKDKHSINAVGGFSYQQWNSRGSSITSSDFPTDALLYNAFQLAGTQGTYITTEKNKALESVIGRVNYAFDRRYLLTVTGRYDGATRLADGHRWQLFPSVGLGWNVSNEKFFTDHVKFISQLKLRGSYGIAGNENIAIGASQAKYKINYTTVGTTIIPTFVVDDIANENIKWEKTKQIDLGTDISFAHDRVSLSIDVYQKNTTDLLINLPVPTSSGIGSYYTNIGEVLNKGIDFEGNVNILKGKVKMDAGFNFSVFDNKVLRMGDNGVVYGPEYLSGGSVALNQSLQVAKVGYPISSFWGFKTAGVYQTAAQVAAGPEAGVAKPGQVIFVDTNGDGQISDADKTVIGNPAADFTYGFNTNLSYKRFSFSMSIFGSQGNQLLNLNRWVTAINFASGLGPTTGYNLTQESFNNRWTGPGTSNLYPAPITNADGPRLKGRFPDWLVENASFLRLQSVQIGYTFALRKLNIGGLKAYISATNLFTITGYKGYDPNVNAFGNQAVASGVDLGTLPQARTISGGFELTF